MTRDDAPTTVKNRQDPLDLASAQEPGCICWDGNPDNFEGPQRDCPIHGEQPAGEMEER